MSIRVIGYLEIGPGKSFNDQFETVEKFCQDNDFELVFHIPEIEAKGGLKDRPALKKAIKMLVEDPVQYIVCTNDLDFGLLKHSLSTMGKGILVASETQQSTLQLPLRSNRRAG